MAFFVIIVLANIFFFVFWIVKMYQEMRAVILIKYSKIYVALCLCFDNQKLE